MLKTLSLTQPYATLIALGYKLIETRPRGCSYRGPLLIHASVTRAVWAKEACTEPRIAGILEKHGLTYDTLPRGVILCSTQLRSVARMVVQASPAPKRKGAKPRPPELVLSTVSPAEREVGFYAPGRFGWQLDEVQVLPEPVPAKGALSLWDATNAVHTHSAALAQQLLLSQASHLQALVQPTAAQLELLSQANARMSRLNRTFTL